MTGGMEHTANTYYNSSRIIKAITVELLMKNKRLGYGQKLP